MENTRLETVVNDYIVKRSEDAKIKLQKQINSFGNVLLKEISKTFRNLDIDGVRRLYVRAFAYKIIDEIDALLKILVVNEIEFYNKNMKTADLIFNINDITKRNQRIYLANIIKKIEKKSNDIELIFSNSSKAILNPNEEKSFLSINGMYEDFLSCLTSNPKLTLDEVEDIRILVNRYFETYKSDFKLVLENFYKGIQEYSISKIDDEIENKDITNGKSKLISKLEREITSKSIDKINNELLVKNIEFHKTKALSELSECSSYIVELIFKLLPIEYRDQKGLLEVIVDTNLNERLGNLLNIEMKKLSANLVSKNENILENELYEEKRYLKIDDYQFDYALIDRVYQDILHEIRIAYDIPEPGRAYRSVVPEIRIKYNVPDLNEERLEKQSKKLTLIVLGESDSTKNVFKNLIESVIRVNESNLKVIISKMHIESKEAYVDAYNQGRNLVLKKNENQ